MTMTFATIYVRHNVQVSGIACKSVLGDLL